MERTAAITGDCMGLYLNFSLRRKIWGNHFPGQKLMFPLLTYLFIYFWPDSSHFKSGRELALK
jgi:hypothetical protein